MIYLDNNATTPLDPSVLEAMQRFLTTEFGNPSSSYLFSRVAKKALQTAREQVAALLDCEPEEIIFTSGGTEADNTAFFSATELYPERRHLITCATEHDAVLKYARWLAQTRGYEVTELLVDDQGRLDLAMLQAAIRPGQTALVSLMWGNNETGVLHDAPRAAAICAEAGVLFHTDAVQVAGKIPMNLRATEIHYLAISGHKFHAPKGIGALYVKRTAPYRPMLLGGGQEANRRAGTENVPYIAALGAASEAARHHLEAYSNCQDPVLALRQYFEEELVKILPEAQIHGCNALRTPNTTNMRLPGCDASGMIILLDQRKICVSAGSACHSGNLHPSHVLAAMGRSSADARECLRISFSRFNTKIDAAAALDGISAAAAKLRATLTH
jgi:cysteine desulfurase